MNITIIGRGHVGGNLAQRWQNAGHIIKLIGRDGGDASDADVVMVALPSGSISATLRKVTGLEGKIAIDAANAYTGRNEQFDSFAHEVKSFTGGPTAKAFNTIYTSNDEHSDDPRVSSNLLFAADEGARSTTERLIRDAGFDPVFIGGLATSRLLENFFFDIIAPIRRVRSPFFYRFAKPREL
jgi:8-hydroxy-5-deazaflavin:NADPH oxidoreductase